VNDPDAVFARAQNRLAANAAAARIRPSQRDQPAADQLLRRFAERMRGTEQTMIVLGRGPNKTMRRKSGLFRSYTYQAEVVDERPHAMGWAFLTSTDSAVGRYHTTSHGDRDSRNPTWETYCVLAVDTGGQLYLAVTGTKPPYKMGLLNLTDVQAFGEGKVWDGDGRRLLSWCDHYPPMSRPCNTMQEVREYEQAVAEYDKLVAAPHQFLTPGLAAALSEAGR
jgi:hypothetical protein